MGAVLGRADLSRLRPSEAEATAEVPLAGPVAVGVALSIHLDARGLAEEAVDAGTRVGADGAPILRELGRLLTGAGRLADEAAPPITVGSVLRAVIPPAVCAAPLEVH